MLSHTTLGLGSFALNFSTFSLILFTIFPAVSLSLSQAIFGNGITKSFIALNPDLMPSVILDTLSFMYLNILLNASPILSNAFVIPSAKPSTKYPPYSANTVDGECIPNNPLKKSFIKSANPVRASPINLGACLIASQIPLAKPVTRFMPISKTPVVTSHSN